MLDEMFEQNSSKSAIFLEYENQKNGKCLRIFRWNIYLINHQPLILKSEVGTYSTYIVCLTVEIYQWYYRIGLALCPRVTSITTK